MLYKEIDIVYYGLLRNARKHGRKDGAIMHCCIEQLQGKLIYTRNTLVNAIRKRCAVMNTIDPFSFVVCSISKVMGIV